MALHQHGHTVVAETVDEIALPEWVATVKLARHDSAGQCGYFAAPGGRGQRDETHVPADVELLIRDPHRTVQSERHRAKLPGELRNEREPFLDFCRHALDSDLWIIVDFHDCQRADVEMPRGSLGRQHHGVGA